MFGVKSKSEWEIPPATSGGIPKCALSYPPRSVAGGNFGRGFNVAKIRHGAVRPP